MVNKYETPSPLQWIGRLVAKGIFQRPHLEKRLIIGVVCWTGVLMIIALIVLSQIASFETPDTALGKKWVLYALVLVMTIVLLMGILVFSFSIYYGMILPIMRSEKVLKHLVRGNLKEAASLDTLEKDDPMGGFIQELTINLQELLLLIWNLTETGKNKIESALSDCRQDDFASLSEHPVQNHLKSVSANLNDIQSVIRTFKLFGVDISSDRPVADEDSSYEVRE